APHAIRDCDDAAPRRYRGLSSSLRPGRLDPRPRRSQERLGAGSRHRTDRIRGVRRAQRTTLNVVGVGGAAGGPTILRIVPCEWLTMYSSPSASTPNELTSPICEPPRSAVCSIGSDARASPLDGLTISAIDHTRPATKSAKKYRPWYAEPRARPR